MKSLRKDIIGFAQGGLVFGVVALLLGMGTEWMFGAVVMVGYVGSVAIVAIVEGIQALLRLCRRKKGAAPLVGGSK